MSSSRRHFLRTSSAVAAGFFGLRSCLHPSMGYREETEKQNEPGYGELLTDPDGIIDLPRGFSYKIISKAGNEMDDGLVNPGSPDGMATFNGPYGLTILIRNHELTPDNTGPFGDERKLVSKLNRSKLYDPGHGKTPSSGGTTTVVYDTRRQQVVCEFMSLAGTIRNCAGGPTPWNSWITCEETVVRAGVQMDDGDEEELYETEKDHGYNFEVPAMSKMALADPLPLTDMGRFNHEAVAVDPKSSVVYETEDRDDGLVYRYLPNKKAKLADGGRLQVLKIADKASTDTRNWDGDIQVHPGQKLAVEWIDIDDVHSPEDDMRHRGFDAGAARFARGEGMWYGNGDIFFACTSGGEAKAGQIWRYSPGPNEGRRRESRSPGTLELFIEPNDSELLKAADNLTVAPWGDLFVCEDRSGEVVRILGVTRRGQLYPFAHNHVNTEFAGITFSPHGSTMFVNMQGRGLTVAITGPWRGGETA